MISVSFFVWNKESMFPIDKSWEKQRIYLWETWKKVSQIFLSETPFVFPWEKPFRNHKTCLEWVFLGETPPSASSDHNSLRYQAIEDVIHHDLERRWTVAQPEKHNQWFEESSVCSERSLPLISFFHPDIVEPHRTSSLVKYLAPLSLLMSLEMRGRGYLFLAVIAFRAR